MDSYSIVAEVLKAQFAVTEYKKVRHVVMLYDAPMQAAFPLRVTRGKWMPDSVEGTQSLPAVIGGSQESKAKVGEEILLTIDGNSPFNLASGFAVLSDHMPIRLLSIAQGLRIC